MSILVYCIILITLLLFPQSSARSAYDALAIWGLHVVPSLFPYMVFSKLLCEQIKMTSCPPVIVCSLLGVFGGSPSGAAMISAYRARLSQRSILFLSAFTGIISPMFFLGTISRWTGDALLCLQLLSSQIIGAFLAALCILPFSSNLRISETQRLPVQSGQVSPLSQSIDSVLQVGGYIICFSVISSLIGILPLPDAFHPILHALLEISGGVHSIVLFPFSPNARALVLSLVCGFGGLCILFQNLLFLKPLGIRLPAMLMISCIRSLFSAAVILVLLWF